MEYVRLYKCLCDEHRMRILNLLKDGPLCVCHLMEILELDQVKVSKQLRYMKELGLVEGERMAQWMIYRLVDPENVLLVENLKCLQDCCGEAIGFGKDMKMRKEIHRRMQEDAPVCATAIINH